MREGPMAKEKEKKKTIKAAPSHVTIKINFPTDAKRKVTVSIP
jgi:hypothetical protein